jgi:SSS family solute:Na+ symporter
MGLMCHAAGIVVQNPQDAVPQLFLKMFPDWFAGFCFAAIAIGALVPAAVMSIGAANTFTRNVWKPFVNRDLTPAAESFIAKLMSLVVKVGALLVILFIPTKFAIDFQLLGGVWMSQCFPAIVFGLFTRWYNGWALLVGWAVGMGLGTYLSWGATAWVPTHSVFDMFTAYNGLTAMVTNVLVSTVLSIPLRSKAPDQTSPADYERAAVAS